jgi:hypothetical protein
MNTSNSTNRRSNDTNSAKEMLISRAGDAGEKPGPWCISVGTQNEDRFGKNLNIT